MPVVAGGALARAVGVSGARRSTISELNLAAVGAHHNKLEAFKLTVSPRLGKRPNLLTTRPPTVSKSSSENFAAEGFVEILDLGHGLDAELARLVGQDVVFSLSKSYSSSMSPTICSNTSSMVMSPATPPYSSTTMAM